MSKEQREQREQLPSPTKRSRLLTENDPGHDYDYDGSYFDVTEQMEIETHLFRPLSRYMNNDPHEDLT